jgi:predicted esterase
LTSQQNEHASAKSAPRFDPVSVILRAMETRTIETPTHGRFHYEQRDAERLLVGFHGYAEQAEWNLAEMNRLPGIERWSVVAVEALHRFYTRSGQIVGNWMTSVERDLSIADNIAYIKRILGTLPTPRSLVFLGFSQGASMAARAAAYARKADGLILLGGDIPPELKADPSIQLPPALLARGEKDEWYAPEKFKDDLNYLERTTSVTSCVFPGGHEWSDEFRAAAGTFLAAR